MPTASEGEAHPSAVTDPIVAALIRSKAKRLARQKAILSSDRGDFEQEFAMAFFLALKKYNPARGSRNAFVKGVLDRTAANLLRHRRAKRRDGSHLLCREDVRQVPTDKSQEDEKHVDLTVDIATILARLPENLRRVAELLMHETPAEAARQLGIPRSTFYMRLREIRNVLDQTGMC